MSPDSEKHPGQRTTSRATPAPHSSCDYLPGLTSVDYDDFDFRRFLVGGGVSGTPGMGGSVIA